MHNNYYFIRQLILELKSVLPGFKLIDAYSQNKDEAIFSFIKQAEEYHIVSHLTGQFTCLAFPSEYAKARKNTATIFSELIGRNVISIQGYTNERALSILFEDDYLLVFKLFGRQSNLILYNKNKVIELFKKGYKSDLELNELTLNRSINQNFEDILNSLPNYRSVFPTLHKKMVSYIDAKIEGKTSDDSATIISDIINQYSSPHGYRINYVEKPALEIEISKNADKTIASATEAATTFFFDYLKYYRLDHLKTRLLQEIDRKIGKTQVYLAKVKRKVNTIEHETNYKSIADIIMANLHNIPKNVKEVSLPDFYTEGKLVNIKINPLISPQQNAERFYKKSKNVNLEIANLNESIKAKQKLISALEQDRKEIENTTDLRTLKKYLKTDGVKKKSKETPFKEFIIDGYTVYVGNNAKQNDLLTLKYAKKEDLFFHAKDVSGSHVILKQKAGTNVPAKVLEVTASIAAYYSKRKTDTLCPVGYTKKKYVRKPKGSVPGLVLVEREKVLLVPPQLPEVNQQH